MPTEPVNRAVNWEERLDKEEFKFNERELKIIEALENYPEGLGFNELAKALKDYMARPTLSKVIERLEEAGVIIRDREKWRPGKKMVIRLNPEFSRELKIVLECIRDFRYKVLYIIKELRYEIAKGSMPEDEAVDELQGIFDIVLNIFLNAVVEVMHSRMSEAYRKAIGSILLKVYIEIINEILRTPEFMSAIEYLPRGDYSVFEEYLNKWYKEAVERASKLGVDEAIRRELGSP